ncbi:MAG: insulinase family protein [Anaerolineales bacterium]|nr:insulinase family protein [Anaerolineales bacterium]
MQPVIRHTLPNGLLILMREDRSAPIISHWVWYRVGSRDEVPGKTGISHWVEHMQFKGTQKYPAGVLDKAVSREGGFWNAFTFLDWTAYFETMPAHKIDLALELEADRMEHSLFDPNEVESERTVIISERQGHENEPMFRLSEEVRAAAFRVHNYHHEVIGDMADLHTIQREDLYQHYRSYYRPNNAVIAVAGDFNPAQMLERLTQIYAEASPGTTPVRYVRPEPAQQGERRVVVEGPGETTYLQVVYKVPAASDPDFYPLLVLDSLLSGATSLDLFGQGISNKTSRLYRALVEGELAVSVHGGPQATIDPFLYAFVAVVHPQSSADKIILALDDEIARIQETPPEPSELRRSVKQAHALFAYGNERITNQAFWLGFSEMIDDYTWHERYLAQLEAVTPADVQRVAQTYLRPQNRVLGLYLPTGERGEAEA